MKDIILINYTGSKGGGAQYALELTRTLIEKGLTMGAIISDQNEDLSSWKKLPLEKLVIIQTYKTPWQLLINSISWENQREQIKSNFKQYNIKKVIIPMITFWSKRINKLFKDAQSIVVLHDPIPHSGDKNKFFLKVFGESSLLKEAKHIVVLSSMFKEYVERVYKKNNQVSIIPLGTPNLYAEIDNKEEAITYDQNKINFLFFGTISKYKGIEILASAYREISAKNKEISLTIAGSGDFDIYKSQFDDLPNVRIFNRWIKNEEVESFFVGPNIVAVLPYIDSTQSGVIPLCLKYKVPVLASETGGIIEQMRIYNGGILFPPNNSQALAEIMDSIINNSNVLEHIRMNLNEKAEDFEWESIAQKFLWLLEE